MSKAYYGRRKPRGGTKNPTVILLVVGVVSMLLLAQAASSGLLSGFVVGQSIWETNTDLYAAQASTFYRDITQGAESSIYPVVNTGQIVIDPSGQNGASKVRFTIGTIYPVLRDGSASPNGEPVLADTYTINGLIWEQYYFQFDVMMATAAKSINWEFGAYPVDAEIYVGVNVYTEFTNNSLKSQFGGAQVVDVVSEAVIPSQNGYLTGTPMPGTGDHPPRIQPYQSRGSMIGPQNIKSQGTDRNKWYIMQLGGYLTPGIGHSYFLLLETGISFFVDVEIKYTVRFSILCSRPPLINSENLKTLDNFLDRTGTPGQLLQALVNLFGGLLNFVLTVLMIVVALVLVFKLLPSRRSGTSNV